VSAKIVGSPVCRIASASASPRVENSGLNNTCAALLHRHWPRRRNNHPLQERRVAAGARFAAPNSRMAGGSARGGSAWLADSNMTLGRPAAPAPANPAGGIQGRGNRATSDASPTDPNSLVLSGRFPPAPLVPRASRNPAGRRVCTSVVIARNPPVESRRHITVSNSRLSSIAVCLHPFRQRLRMVILRAFSEGLVPSTIGSRGASIWGRRLKKDDRCYRDVVF